MTKKLVSVNSNLKMATNTWVIGVMTQLTSKGNSFRNLKTCTKGSLRTTFTRGGVITSGSQTEKTSRKANGSMASARDKGPCRWRMVKL